MTPMEAKFWTSKLSKLLLKASDSLLKRLSSKDYSNITIIVKIQLKSIISISYKD